MVQSDTVFWLQRILSHGLLTPQICWQSSTSRCSSVLQKWSGLAGALCCLPFKSIDTLPPPPQKKKPRSFDRIWVRKWLQMERCWQIRKCDYIPGREGVMSSWWWGQSSRLLLGMSCNQNTSDPALLKPHSQPHSVHGVAFTPSKGASHWPPILTIQDQTSAAQVTFLVVFPDYWAVNFTAWIVFSEHVFVHKYKQRYMLCKIHVHHAYVWLFIENHIFLLPFLCCALGNTQGADESVLWHGQNHDESIKWTSQGTFKSHRYFRDT